MDLQIQEERKKREDYEIQKRFEEEQTLQANKLDEEG